MAQDLSPQDNKKVLLRLCVRQGEKERSRDYSEGWWKPAGSQDKGKKEQVFVLLVSAYVIYGFFFFFFFLRASGFPDGSADKESACQYRRSKRHGFHSWVGKIPWRRKWQPTPVFLHEKSHGQGRKESDMTERLHRQTRRVYKCSVSLIYK